MYQREKKGEAGTLLISGGYDEVPGGTGVANTYHTYYT